MGFGASLFLLAVGAILTFATSLTVNGINLDTVGVILMVLGGLGILLGLVWADSAFGYRKVTYRDRREL